MKIRRLRIGEPRGDFDFIHSSLTKPLVRGDSGTGDAMEWQACNSWYDFQEPSNQNNVQSQFQTGAVPYPRYLRVPSSGNPSLPYGAFHPFTSVGGTLKMVFGYKSGENSGTVELRDSAGTILMQYILSADPQVTRYTYAGGQTRYNLLVLGKQGSVTGVQSLTHVRVWDELDLSQYLEQLVPYSVERTLYQSAPFAFTSERTEAKSAVATFLLTRSDWGMLQQMLADDEGSRLELVHEVGNDVFLLPIAVRSVRAEPVAGTLVRVTLEVSAMQSWAYLDARLSSTSTNVWYHSWTDSLGDAPAPICAHVLVDSAYLNIAYQLVAQPADRRMQFTPDEAGRWYYMEDGRLILVRSTGEWVDKSSKLAYNSEPLAGLPGSNRLTVRFPSGGGPASLGEIGVHYHPRIGELTLV